MKNLTKTFHFKFILASALISVSLFFVVSCKTALYVPTEANLTQGTSLKDLQDGREIYSNRCGRCHWLHAPEKYSPDQWKTYLNKMRKRAKLNDAEYSLVEKYVNKGRQ